MAQEQVHPRRSVNTEEETTEVTQAVSVTQSEDLTADIDAVLADIDDVLEANAEEFVRSFIQKGGQ